MIDEDLLTSDDVVTSSDFAYDDFQALYPAEAAETLLLRSDVERTESFREPHIANTETKALMESFPVSTSFVPRDISPLFSPYIGTTQQSRIENIQQQSLVSNIELDNLQFSSANTPVSTIAISSFNQNINKNGSSDKGLEHSFDNSNISEGSDKLVKDYHFDSQTSGWFPPDYDVGRNPQLEKEEADSAGVEDRSASFYPSHTLV